MINNKALCVCVRLGRAELCGVFISGGGGELWLFVKIGELGVKSEF